MNQIIDQIDLISNEKKIDIFRKNWMSHDARAQMAIVQEFGWKKGNKINKKIIHEMGKVMMHRFMNALNIDPPVNIEEVYNLATAAIKFYYPPPYAYYKFQIISDKEIKVFVQKCPIIEKVKKSGFADFYECGCYAMRSGWHKAMRIDAYEESLLCMKDGDKECQSLFKVKNWNIKS